MDKIGEPETEYREACGCIWRYGRRIHVCSFHLHRHGITPQLENPRQRYMC